MCLFVCFFVLFSCTDSFALVQLRPTSQSSSFWRWCWMVRAGVLFRLIVLSVVPMMKWNMVIDTFYYFCTLSCLNVCLSVVCGMCDDPISSPHQAFSPRGAAVTWCCGTKCWTMSHRLRWWIHTPASHCLWRWREVQSMSTRYYLFVYLFN